MVVRIKIPYRSPEDFPRAEFERLPAPGEVVEVQAPGTRFRYTVRRIDPLVDEPILEVAINEGWDEPYDLAGTTDDPMREMDESAILDGEFADRKSLGPVSSVSPDDPVPVS